MELKGLSGAVAQIVVKRSDNSLAPITIALRGHKRSRIEIDVTTEEAQQFASLLRRAADGAW